MHMAIALVPRQAPGCNEPQKGNGIGSGIHPIRRVSVVGQRASGRVRVRGRGQACAGEQRSEGGEDEGPMTCVKLQAASARVGCAVEAQKLRRGRCEEEKSKTTVKWMVMVL
jgi:hypothetical protein